MHRIITNPDSKPGLVKEHKIINCASYILNQTIFVGETTRLSSLIIDSDFLLDNSAPHNDPLR